jgi:hypothetical protein
MYEQMRSRSTALVATSLPRPGGEGPTAGGQLSLWGSQTLPGSSSGRIWRVATPALRLAVTEVIDSFQANPPSA